MQLSDVVAFAPLQRAFMFVISRFPPRMMGATCGTISATIGQHQLEFDRWNASLHGDWWEVRDGVVHLTRLPHENEALPEIPVMPPSHLGRGVHDDYFMAVHGPNGEVLSEGRLNVTNFLMPRREFNSSMPPVSSQPHGTGERPGI